ncbi:ABC transporter permease [Phocoenobacter skyensis]|uniref:ABC transporter permease n=1 Tax=Phocoenobacter skyensis TaxID=97481 RepID=A0A1H7YM95_9PAST|nr:ABC transporter permease [Pasteurella skyensis]MDP8079853.1 ABC transporter permease [Pasteurella skyensis]MDP8085921.1 ABC transporter permease [Pasteurella skyensis]MDP8174718.1 ABC transporter permease [Pasteurella skyensis]MDP8185658.1 ABC transporter permease [Pasteurella skyensis]QLB22083.1 sugar ABC transporter permease [Pasteurella skyensis]
MANYLRSIEGILFVFIIFLSIILSFATPDFFTLQNFFDLLNQNAVKMIFAIGLLVVLIIGGIDISFAVGASVIQYATVTILMKMLGGGSWLSGMLIAMAIGAMLGMINALLIYGFRVVSIIITIATFNVFFGLLIFFTNNGRSIYRLPDWLVERMVFIHIDNTTMLYLPVAVMLIVALVTTYILKFTGFGRQLYGYGSNAEGARRAGVSGWKVHLFAYGWLGVCAGIAGMMQITIAQEVVPKALYGWEFDVLVAVVLGGATLGGGRGSVLGAMLGVLFLALLKNAMILLQFSPYAFNAISGAVILLAIIATQWQVFVRKLQGGLV